MTRTGRVKNVGHDSAGRKIREGSRVKFRQHEYTIKRFYGREGLCGTAQIEFIESQHTDEIADEISVDLV